MKSNLKRRKVKSRRWYVTMDDGEYTHGLTVTAKAKPCQLDKNTIKIGRVLLVSTDCIESIETI